VKVPPDPRTDSLSPPRLPAGPRAPGVVQTLAWMYRPIPFIERCHRRFGPIFTLRLGPGRNTVVVAELEAARTVLTGDPEVYRAGDANGILRPVVGPNSLLVLDGPEHMSHRRILLPAFGPEHGSAFAERVADVAARRIERWRPGQTLRLQEEMEAISFEVILRVAFGVEDTERGERFRRLIPEMMRRCSSPFTLLPYFRRELGGITPYARLRRVLDELDQLFAGAIADRRREGPREGADILSLLVAATDADGEPLDDGAIRDELLTTVMAGYETTTSALAWSLERLLRSPSALDRLLAELGSGSEQYLDAVVKETLRIRPVVPVVARKLAADAKVGNHTLPAGSVLLVSVLQVHRDPLLYEDPEEFWPERFLEGEQEGGLWIPFGGGVRRCLGANFAQLEMKVVLRTVLSSARLEAEDPAPERVTRRRFTFAPARGARATVVQAGGFSR
jgi:cytochrome P450 family 135